MAYIPPFFRRLLTGLTLPQEYICLGAELTDPLRVFLSIRGGREAVDVTGTHLMLGYKPLLIAFPVSDSDPHREWLERQENVSLSLQENSPEVNSLWRRYPSDTNTVAHLELKRINELRLEGFDVFFFEAINGEHQFINGLHQRVAAFRERSRKRKEGNVSLPGNLYDQVRIAYAIPRSVQLITVSEGKNMNMFPTDLHGAAGERLYFCSLRQGGKATNQVEHLGKMVLSEVRATAFTEVYSLGNNHMQDLKGHGYFNLHEQKSAMFGFPLPAAVVRYRELEHRQYLDAGIHRIHFFKVAGKVTLSGDDASVHHIHQFYAQWRETQGKQTPMLIR